MVSLILLSGGKGTRMRKDLPKQYLLLAGKPIIMHSLERVGKIKKIDEIIIVCAEEYISYLQELIKKYNVKVNVKFALAGQTRQESVYNGLKCVSNSSVLIHESARPFVLKEEFEKLIEDESENITYGYSIPYTVAKGKDYFLDTLKREELVNIQLPQKFNTKTLIMAHEQAIKDEALFTEDASMLHKYSKDEIKILEGTSFNLKITEPIDLLIGELIYKEYIIRRK